MMMGIPMVPALAASGICLVAGMWLYYLLSGYWTLLLAGLYAPGMVWMRHTTSRDDQRLRQMMLRLRMRARQIAARRFWQAVSFSPLRYKRRSVL